MELARRRASSVWHRCNRGRRGSWPRPGAELSNQTGAHHHRIPCRRLKRHPRALARRFLDLGTVVLPGSPNDFAKLIAEDTEKWANVVKIAGIKVS
jgi:hypothetical protein